MRQAMNIAQAAKNTERIRHGCALKAKHDSTITTDL